MKRKRAYLRIFIFMMVLVLPSVLWMIFQATGATETLDFDLGEKRNKHEITLSKGGANLTSELEAWYNDRVPFRSIILKAEGAISNAVETPYEKLIEPALIAAVNKKMNKDAQADASENSGADVSASSLSVTDDTSALSVTDDTAGNTADGSAGDAAGQQDNSGDTAADTSVQTGTEDAQADGGPVEGTQEGTADDGTAAPAVSTEEVPSDGTQGPSDTGYFPYKELSPEVIRGRDDWLFYTGTLPDYTGTNLVSEGELAYEALILTQLRDYFRSNGTELYCLVVPNKNSIYSEYMPTLEQAPVRRAQIAEQYMQANTDLFYNYIYEELLAEKSGHQLYYRLDTHWNAYGALAGADFIHGMLGLPYIDRTQLAETSAVFESPDLVAMSGTAGDFGTDTRYDLNYNLYVTPTQVMNAAPDGTYYEFITPDAPYQGTLVLIGDSFRIALLDYLPRDFSHVVFIDQLANWTDYWGVIMSADKIIIEEAERNEYFFVSIAESMISYIYS